MEGWRTRLDGLTGDEAAALFLAGVPGAAGELGLSAVLVAAQEKVLATLPAELRGRAARIRERFHLDAPGWFHRREAVPNLGVVAAAVWGNRPLRLRYAGRQRSTSVDVDPLGLVLKAGTWYLVASGGRDIRTYRISRIVEAQTRDGTVQRPAGFDLAAWWAGASADFGDQLRTVPCRLRLDPGALRRLPHIGDPVAGRAAALRAGPPDADGWHTVELTVESIEVAADELRALAGGVEVLAPPGLRRALAEAGAAMAAHNAAPGPTT
jgi:predicted DNA-binding transcriptional regulator YafY